MKSNIKELAVAQESPGVRLTVRKWLLLGSIVLLSLVSVAAVHAQGLLYTVTSTGDGDLVGTDTICDDGAGQCTLRAALEASNSHPGTDGINFDIPTSDPGFDPLTGSWTINLTKALPDMSDPVGISGLGADLLIVRRDTGGDYRIFNVTAPHSLGGAVTFSGITISNGNAPLGEGGGGIQNSSTGTVTVLNSTISGNNVRPNFNVGGLGGGIYNANFGTVNVINSILSDNSSAYGGGIYIGPASTVSVINSTITKNTTSVGSSAIASEGTLNLTNSTVSSNFAFDAGSVRAVGAEGVVNIKSSIIALNTSPVGAPDVLGNYTSAGFNLIGNADFSFGFDQPTDQTGTSGAPLDPKLDPDGLQDNGGATETIALLFGSPGIDKGTSDGLTGTLTTDQRGAGFPRTFDNLAIANATGGDGTDVGAFEVQSATPTPTPIPTPTPTPTPVPTTLGNISTRLRVETGDNVLIGGFIITGSQPKKVLMRAIGPSLPLAGVLANPTLELRDDAGTLVASNDNWMDAPNRQEIIDSTIPPSNDLESAILMSLDPGAYTAIVRGVNDNTGIGLVEAYDLDLTADSILANISTRGLVQTGDDVMIGGFIVVGEAAQQVLVRAIGPSLPVTGALADPTLELHDKDGSTIASNDDWRSDQEADIIGTTIPPTDDAESAILATLTPDAYTAIVRGKNGTTGVALVEAYQLDN